MVAKTAITQSCGWLSPLGRFYDCAYGEHCKVAENLGYSEWSLERLGWIKIQRGLVIGSTEPTQSQVNAVFNWCCDTGRKIPSWILLCF